jgi:predicted nucleotidyltransferase
MDRDQVIATLRAHEPELKAAGILRLRVFGSVARGDHGADSDLDIIVDFDEVKGGVSLLELVRLENRLSDLLGAHVDLVQGKSLKARVRRNAEREAVVAF